MFLRLMNSVIYMGCLKLDFEGMDRFTGGRTGKQKSITAITACEKELKGVK